MSCLASRRARGGTNDAKHRRHALRKGGGGAVLRPESPKNWKVGNLGRMPRQHGVHDCSWVFPSLCLIFHESCRFMHLHLCAKSLGRQGGQLPAPAAVSLNKSQHRGCEGWSRVVSFLVLYVPVRRACRLFWGEGGVGWALQASIQFAWGLQGRGYGLMANGAVVTECLPLKSSQ